tara:strand:+ start:523 stop:1065 length:543 start_codon:yes stop_codon:yes gene_type:complete
MPRYFYKNRCRESNVYKHAFTHDGFTADYAEVHLMRAKARLFGDLKTAARIESVKWPGDAKKLGSKVANFDARVWDEASPDIMTSIACAKFTSTRSMREEFLATKGPFYEASPDDAVWGIGISVEQAEQGDPHNGENRLGRALNRAQGLIRDAWELKRPNDEIAKQELSALAAMELPTDA